MIEPHQVFVADARPALALPTQCSAYVFGAASPLGEALLNQLLANPRYTQVYVSTTAPLPGSVAHLTAVQSIYELALHSAAEQVDVVLVVGDNTEPRTRSTVYAPLQREQVPALLRQIASAMPIDASFRYLVVTPNLPTLQAAQWLSSYAGHAPCLVYGLGEGAVASASKQAYTFKPQANSLLDRLGAWVLNVLSNAAHSMLNPQTHVSLTSVKTAQRLVQRFEGLNARGAVQALQAQDLQA
jgi:hypothetical protein